MDVELTPSENAIGAHFAELASAYRDLVDGRAQSDPQGFLRRAHLAVARLYAAGLTLPAVEPANASAVPNALTDEQQASLHSSLGGLLGQAAIYHDVFDPLGGPSEVAVEGDLADDLADIYDDLVRGLRCWNDETESGRREALWVWRENFGTHWGRHAADVIRVLYAQLHDGRLGDTSGEDA